MFICCVCSRNSSGVRDRFTVFQNQHPGVLNTDQRMVSFRKLTTKYTIVGAKGINRLREHCIKMNTFFGKVQMGMLMLFLPLRYRYFSSFLVRLLWMCVLFSAPAVGSSSSVKPIVDLS